MSLAVLGRSPLVARRGSSGRVPVAVLAAHPDDESIGASALLLRSPGAAVIHLTDGVPHDRAFWPRQLDCGACEYAGRRRAELRRAMAVVGVAEARLLALGAPDQEAALNLAPLATALARVLSDLRPRRIVTHSYEGGHPDHDAAAFVARAALELLRRAGVRAPPLHEMSSYHAGPDGQLAALSFLEAGASPIHTRVLRPHERAAKDEMLAAFETQRDVISWFPRDVERLRRAPRCDFARPPHDGPLWYERMGFAMDGARWRALAREAAAQLAREHPALRSAERIAGAGAGELDILATGSNP